MNSTEQQNSNNDWTSKPGEEQNINNGSDTTKENDSSLGSAMMAGVAAGIFSDFEDSVRKCTSVADVVRPIPQNVDLYNRGFEYYRLIQQAMAAVYDSMF